MASLSPRAASAPGIATILGLLCIAVAVRGPTFGIAELDWDESAFALVAREILHNHWPFTTVFDDKSIVLFLHYAAAFALFGDSPVSFRVMGTLMVAAGAALVALIGTRRLQLSPRWGFLLGVCYIIASTGFGGQAVYSEHFINTYALLAAYWLCDGRRWRVFLAGFAAGIAINCNYLAIPLVAGLVLGHAIGASRAGKGNIFLVEQLLCFAAGAFIASGLVLLPIFVLSDPASYFYPQWRFMTGYTAARPFGQIAYDYIVQARLFLPIVGLAAALVHLRRRSTGAALEPAPSAYHAWAFGGMGAGAAIAALATGHIWVHYFLLGIAPATLLPASLLDRKIPDRSIIAGAVLFASASLIGLPGLAFTATGARDIAAGAISGHMRQDLSHRLAALASSQVREGDTIYVLCAPLALYQLLHTTPPTKYPLYPQSMNAQFAAALGVNLDVEVSSIFAARPAVVFLGDYPLCDSIPPGAWAKVRDSLKEKGYQPFARSDGFTLFVSPPISARKH